MEREGSEGGKERERKWKGMENEKKGEQGRKRTGEKMEREGSEGGKERERE